MLVKSRGKYNRLNMFRDTNIAKIYDTNISFAINIYNILVLVIQWGQKAPILLLSFLASRTQRGLQGNIKAQLMRINDSLWPLCRDSNNLKNTILFMINHYGDIVNQLQNR